MNNQALINLKMSKSVLEMVNYVGQHNGQIDNEAFYKHFKQELIELTSNSFFLESLKQHEAIASSNLDIVLLNNWLIDDISVELEKNRKRLSPVIKPHDFFAIVFHIFIGQFVLLFKKFLKKGKGAK